MKNWVVVKAEVGGRIIRNVRVGEGGAASACEGCYHTRLEKTGPPPPITPPLSLFHLLHNAIIMSTSTEDLLPQLHIHFYHQLPHSYSLSYPTPNSSAISSFSSTPFYSEFPAYYPSPSLFSVASHPPSYHLHHLHHLHISFLLMYLSSPPSFFAAIKVS